MDSPDHRNTIGDQGFMQRAVGPSWGRVSEFKDGHLRRRPSTPRRRQIGRPNARPRTGCIARRTSFLRIVFKVLCMVYYCASVGADFYSFSYRTSCDLVARDQNLSPLAQPGFWCRLPAGRNRLCLHGIRTESHRTKSHRTKSHRTESHRTESHNIKSGQNPTV